MENAATDNCVRECDTCFFTVIPSRFSPTWTGGTATEPVMTVVGLTYRTESLGGLDQQYLLSCVREENKRSCFERQLGLAVTLKAANRHTGQVSRRVRRKWRLRAEESPRESHRSETR
jgi:hypothetical protein